jgi:hypothetical protein
MLVGLEQTPDVQCLPPPEVSVNTPVKRELEGTAIESTACLLAGVLATMKGRSRAQDGDSAGHDCSIAATGKEDVDHGRCSGAEAGLWVGVLVCLLLARCRRRGGVADAGRRLWSWLGNVRAAA